MTGGATSTVGGGAQTGGGTTTTGAGRPITTPGRGIPIPMFKRTPACEAAAAPNNTAEINSIRFIQQVRRSTEATCFDGGRISTRFSLNKLGGLASVARSGPRSNGMFALAAANGMAYFLTAYRRISSRLRPCVGRERA